MWDISIEQSFEAALEKARKLSANYIVHSIENGIGVVLDEKQIREKLGLK